MFEGIITTLINAGLGGIIDKAADVYKRKAELAVDEDKLRADLTAEYLKQALEESKIQADLAKTKMEHPGFWIMIYLFIVPLGLWWSAVLLDSIFNFPFSVANLPTPEMRAWAGSMITWLFYTGVGVLGFKALLRR